MIHASRIACVKKIHFWQLNRPKSNMANKYKFRTNSNIYHIPHPTHIKPHKATFNHIYILHIAQTILNDLILPFPLLSIKSTLYGFDFHMSWRLFLPLTRFRIKTFEPVSRFNGLALLSWRFFFSFFVLLLSCWFWHLPGE